MIKFFLYPYDILFFGKGKPFNPGSQDMFSSFPPLPHISASSICAKIYFEKGINISKILKSLYGPFIIKEEKLLFPKPLDILKEMRKSKDYKITSLILIKNNFNLINPKDTDLDDALKGMLWVNKDFEIFQSFINEEGLKKWLNNQDVLNDDILGEDEIFKYESRVGIRMEYKLNTVIGEDALFRINSVRLKEDVGFELFIEFDYNNSELKNAALTDEDKMLDFFSKYPKALRFGGEMRSVSYECEKVNDISSILNLKKPEIKSGDVVKVLFLTPYVVKNNLFDEFKNYGEIISGSLMSMNVGMNNKNYGRKIKKAFVQGSEVYLRVNNPDELDNLWLKPKTGEFIGCNLAIYTKI